MTEERESVSPTIGAPGIGNRFSPRNPLGIIALFVFLIEAIATVSLKFVIGTQYIGHLVWFIILYPTFIALAFFVFLWKKREAFYSPYDFRSDDTFQGLLRSVEVLKVNQDVAFIDESTRVDDALLTVDRLVALGDIRSAVAVGRNYLKQANYDRSIVIFNYLLKRVPLGNELYFKIHANRGYALIGAAQYDGAIAELNRVRQINSGKHFAAWHAVALAYAHFKKGDRDNYELCLKHARELEGFRSNIKHFSMLYPEIRDDLRKLEY
jgi:tetratricopeptide (TPR) repeat protein